MDEKKDLSKVDLVAQADEIRGETAVCTRQLDTVQGLKNQAAVDKREGLTAYNEALADGDKVAMDENISKIATATETLQAPPAGIENIGTRIEEFQSRQKVLIAEARRRKAAMEAKISELTKQLSGAEGTVGNLQALTIEIGKLNEKLRDVGGKEKKREKAATANRF